MLPVTFAPGELYADRYRIERRLGEGAMGVVYRAIDESLGDRVALKVLSLTPSPGQAEAAVERFRREVRLARRVTHRNVARTHDLGQHLGQYYLTMELIEGESLQSVLARRQRLAPTEVIALGCQICDGLAAAHAVSVVHRDLKPANILLEASPTELGSRRVVITDFGIARPLVADDALQTQGLIGTPFYMAPEQVQGSAIDERADVYALGMVLYEMLTGQVAFAEGSAIAVAYARLERDPPDPRDLLPVPSALAELVLACLARAPAARPARADLVGQRLRGADDQATTLAQLPTDMTLPASAATQPRRTSSTGQSGHLGLRRHPALAILPFRTLGRDDDFGELLSDELIDVLSMTRGLRVFASGAVSRFREQRDPRSVGTELGADVIVDGSMQFAADQVRVSARLVDVQSGVQIWSERFSARFEDLLQLQDTLSKRIAEALRVKLTTTRQTDVSPEAVEIYFEARRKQRTLGLHSGAHTPVELLDSCLTLAPTFQPAIAAHAISCIRAWFLPSADPRRDWEALARTSVARAIGEAPELAESHLAAAMLALQDGQYQGCIDGLQRALAIAPTSAEALEYIGVLLCEANRPEQGVPRIELALQLDPTLSVGRIELARSQALLGNQAAFAQQMEQLRALGLAAHPATLTIRMREATWRGDLDEVERAMADTQLSGDKRTAALVEFYGQIVLGRLPATQLQNIFDALIATLRNKRFVTFVHQMLAEALCARGELDAALLYFERAVDGLLFDLIWLLRCPAIQRLRQHERYGELHQRVEQRAAQMTVGR